MSEFPKFGSIPRLHRAFTVTEKIDGTNGLISIEECGGNVIVQAGSRSRWLTPESDNFGFCRWVYDHGKELIELLGPGLHYGEWWGSGIQRGYGLAKGEKRFSLFNVKRWEGVDFSSVPGLGVVPVLAKNDNAGNMNLIVDYVMDRLRELGSLAAPGFMRPEGVVVYHDAANQLFKATLEHDEMPKSQILRLAA